MEYADPDLKVSGTSAEVDPQGGATFEGAKFELPDRNARGSADHIQVTRDNELKLEGVRYTTCPIGEEDWVLRASDIDIRQQAGIGFGRGVRLDFKGVPILYSPFISFPLALTLPDAQLDDFGIGVYGQGTTTRRSPGKAGLSPILPMSGLPI